MRRSIVIVVGLLVAVLGSGTARASDPEVRREGPCTGNSEWKLEVRLDDGAFRVRWEADSGNPRAAVATETPAQRHPHRVHAPDHQRGRRGAAEAPRRGEPARQGHVRRVRSQPEKRRDLLGVRQHLERDRGTWPSDEPHSGSPGCGIVVGRVGRSLVRRGEHAGTGAHARDRRRRERRRPAARGQSRTGRWPPCSATSRSGMPGYSRSPTSSSEANRSCPPTPSRRMSTGSTTRAAR